MAASQRRDDPFQAPGADSAAPELATQPTRAAGTEPVVVTPMAPPQRRQPVKYKRPGTSWVTVVVLGFAAVGMSAIGGTALKKLMGKDAKPTPIEVAQQKAITYSSLSKDDAVLVTVQVSPRDARLTLDGEPAVSNPLRVLRSKSKHRISATAEGYEPGQQEFTADAPRTIRLRLKKN
jgi:hypothetical protein